MDISMLHVDINSCSPCFAQSSTMNPKKKGKKSAGLVDEFIGELGAAPAAAAVPTAGLHLQPQRQQRTTKTKEKTGLP
jgi:hypothetical protein